MEGGFELSHGSLYSRLDLRGHVAICLQDIQPTDTGHFQCLSLPESCRAYTPDVLSFSTGATANSTACPSILDTRLGWAGGTYTLANVNNPAPLGGALQTRGMQSRPPDVVFKALA